jgi:hypothetical protein
MYPSTSLVSPRSIEIHTNLVLYLIPRYNCAMARIVNMLRKRMFPSSDGRYLMYPNLMMLQVLSVQTSVILGR